ncbi:MAG TPA: M23 family metallopeptidase [Kofleriaceae bacterium]|nr:M23 family metallopeptidase [Kofleriaceae bacterium]
MSTAATTRILHAPSNANASAAHRSWVWPLPRLDGAAPSIIEPAREHPPPDGIAIGYRERASSQSLVPVFAAQDGIVTYARSTVHGSVISIDHLGGWSTHYSDLEHLLTRPTDRFRRRRKEHVRAGDVIGHARRPALRIRFGLSRLTDEGCIEQDPASWMLGWSLLPWFAEPTPRVPTRAAL